MPQLKNNLSVARNSILPKLELTLENVYSNYNGTKKEISYVPIFPDLKSCTVLTSEAESDGADSIPPKPRKRQRLDHLSQEEKIMRRKMKNRVAAQTARDRKKARMAELEEQVLELETERKMLLLANMNLQSQCESLKKENEELKLRLSGAETLNQTQVKVEESALVTDSEAFQTAESRLTDSGRSLEHASFINVPLQKGQDLQLLSLWMMQFVCLPLIARMMLFLMFFNNLLKSYSSLKTSALLFQNSQTLLMMQGVKHQPQKWWGPHQKAWNPTKN